MNKQKCALVSGKVVRGEHGWRWEAALGGKTFITDNIFDTAKGARAVMSKFLREARKLHTSTTTDQGLVHSNDC